MHVRIFSIILTLAAVGCASTDATVAAAAASGPAQACEKEYRLGSNIPVRECNKRVVTDEERARTRDQWNDVIKPANTVRGTGG